MSDQFELVCSRCQPTETENARLRQALASLQHEMNDIAEELAGARATQIMLERQVRHYKAELTKAREEGPNAERVKIVLNCYVDSCIGPRGKKRIDISMTSDRAALVMKMLKRRNCGASNVDEQTYVLCRAIRAVGLKPYKLWVDRYAIKPDDPKALRLAKLEHCIGTDERIEENVELYRRACKAAVEKRALVWNWFEQIQALEQQWSWLATAPLVWLEQGADAEDIERYLWERVCAEDRRWQDIIDGVIEPVLPGNVVPIRRAVA